MEHLKTIWKHLKTVLLLSFPSPFLKYNQKLDQEDENIACELY